MMVYIPTKLYPYKEYAELSGKSLFTIRKYVRDKVIKGEIRVSDYFVDSEEFMKLPAVTELKESGNDGHGDGERLGGGDTGGNPDIPSSISVPGESSTKAQTDKQALIDRKALAEQETETIKAEILRDEASKKRALPEELIKQKSFLDNLLSELNGRAKAISDKELELLGRVTALGVKEKEIVDKVRGAEAFYQTKLKGIDAHRAEAEKSMAEINQAIKDLHGTIAMRRNEISDLESKLLEYPDKLAPHKKELESLIGVAEKRGTVHYHKGQKLVGNVGDFHTRKSNKYFNLANEFKRLLAWLTS
jgi:hypothetical protein